MSYHDEMEELRTEQEQEVSESQARPRTELDMLIDLIRKNCGKKNRRGELESGPRLRADLFDK